MQYGSIGWSVGATLGYAQAVPEKRVIACIGDGSFQVCVAHHNYLINILITKKKLYSNSKF
jgi:TPP-dependent 2-oxoacid decarboxylase